MLHITGLFSVNCCGWMTVFSTVCKLKQLKNSSTADKNMITLIFMDLFWSRGWGISALEGRGVDCRIKGHLAEKRWQIDMVLLLYQDQRRDIQWNIAFAWEISQGRRLYFIVYPWKYRYSHLITKYNTCIILLGRKILEEFILRITLAAGVIFSHIDQALLGVNGPV